MRCSRRLRVWLAAATVASGWGAIGGAWLLNRSWFNPLRGAFSDLGSGRACCPQVFNLGLAAAAAVLALYSLCLYYSSATKAAALGAGYLGLSSLFLAQVGAFPEGTGFHNCVATWFFLLADLGLLLYSLGHKGRRGGPCTAAALAAASMLPGAALVAATAGWPSVATLEAYAVALLDVALLASSLCGG